MHDRYGPGTEALFLAQASLLWGQVNPERKKTALRSRDLFPPSIRVKFRDSERESNIVSQSSLKQEILGDTRPGFLWITKLLFQTVRTEWKALCLGP